MQLLLVGTKNNRSLKNVWQFVVFKKKSDNFEDAKFNLV